MGWVALALESALEVTKYLNTPKAEKWAKEILELKEERDSEERKPAWEDRDVYPDLRAKEYRNDARIDAIERKLRNLSEAITAASRARASV